MGGVVHESVYYEGSDSLWVPASGRAEAPIPQGRWLVLWTDESEKEHQVAEWNLSGATAEIELTLPPK